MLTLTLTLALLCVTLALGWWLHIRAIRAEINRLVKQHSAANLLGAMNLPLAAALEAMAVNGLFEKRKRPPSEPMPVHIFNLREPLRIKRKASEECERP